jgi:hypothetical protein
MGLNAGLSTDEMIEVAGGRGRQAQLVRNIGDRSSHRGAAAKDVSSGVVRMQTEATAEIGTMSTRISEHHVVSECNNVEPRVGRKPGWCPGVVAEKMCGLHRLQAHGCAFFVDVLPIRCSAQWRIDQCRINFGGCCAWLDVEIEITISIDAC